jgi:hypothetical protein
MQPLKNIYSQFIALLVSYLTPRNPVLATRILYRHVTGRRLNLKTPATYNEKLLWLKLYNETPLMIQCGDKYGVRAYVQEKGCPELLNELYGVYDTPDEIDFSVLPAPATSSVPRICSMSSKCGGSYKNGRNRCLAWPRRSRII